MKLSDDKLLDIVQQHTLKYFTEFSHPDCGLARERSNVVHGYHYDLDTVTTGGTGFGIMAILSGVKRGWINQNDALKQITKIVNFLEKADRYHGAFPHFLDGRTGKTVPFSPKDDGGDLVETSFLIMGLLSARQFFCNDPNADVLCKKITDLWEGVEWDWYTKGENQLYWHWSSKHGWDMNLPIKGWNESLITYVLAASSPTHPISKETYDKGWASGPTFATNQNCGGIPLALGESWGGPLFLSQYSFLGLDPRQLTDKYADYWALNKNHTLINRLHCISNPHGHAGYGEDCWGLSACDEKGGYGVHSPTNDNGTITPTAALSAFPYTPAESMKVLRHLYENLGDKMWGKYGFFDAFNPGQNWYANNYLAIDQGPIVCMIENHRSGFLWQTFMSCPEIKTGLIKLDFKSPHLPSVHCSRKKTPGIRR